MKVLIWTVIVLIVVLWLVRGKKNKTRSQASTHAPQPDSLDEPQPMIQCAECGVHLPMAEALPGPAGTVFCSDEHRRLHASR
ncbi:PP0621 family protein [Noviherbaspirillum saxi]|uniref:Preprotein translocase subunit YajC n=1 Tax=Noviherbaspirillum saxi TaxID=2320863 RepID=A0A3A3FTE0_9BURK|nr:PP0621 family protein [Noviherbaspirillum saxi]RJF97758.1 hypothetical protein D3871_03895 [Noviherbaspirillum saxi]